MKKFGAFRFLLLALSVFSLSFVSLSGAAMADNYNETDVFQANDNRDHDHDHSDHHDHSGRQHGTKEWPTYSIAEAESFFKSIRVAEGCDVQDISNKGRCKPRFDNLRIEKLVRRVSGWGAWPTLSEEDFATMQQAYHYLNAAAGDEMPFFDNWAKDVGKWFQRIFWNVNKKENRGIVNLAFEFASDDDWNFDLFVHYHHCYMELTPVDGDGNERTNKDNVHIAIIAMKKHVNSGEDVLPTHCPKSDGVLGNHKKRHGHHHHDHDDNDNAEEPMEEEEVEKQPEEETTTESEDDEWEGTDDWEEDDDWEDGRGEQL